MERVSHSSFSIMTSNNAIIDAANGHWVVRRALLPRDHCTMHTEGGRRYVGKWTKLPDPFWVWAPISKTRVENPLVTTQQSVTNLRGWKREFSKNDNFQVISYLVSIKALTIVPQITQDHTEKKRGTKIENAKGEKSAGIETGCFSSFIHFLSFWFFLSVFFFLADN